MNTLNRINEKDVSVELENVNDLKTDRSQYLAFHQELSAKERAVHILFKGQRVFSATVYPGVFNPYGGIAAQIFVSGILSKQVDVRQKRVIDLGCGCGVIGLACILRQCQSVVFTDISPNILPLQSHSLLRAADSVKVQDLCQDEEDASADVVFMSFPSRMVEQVDVSSYEVGILRTDDLVYRTIENVERVLASGGLFVFFYRIFDHQFLDYLTLLAKLGKNFDIGTLEVLWYSKEEKSHGHLLSLKRK